MKKKIFIKISSLLVGLLLFAACDNSYETLISKVVIPDQNHVLGDTLINDSLSGHVFSRLYRHSTAGLQFQYDIPTEHQQKKMLVIAGGKIRSNYAMSNSGFAVSVYDNHSKQLVWTILPLKIAYLGINKWVYARDSVLIRANYYNAIPAHVSVNSYLGESKQENFDLDSMFVIIKMADH